MGLSSQWDSCIYAPLLQEAEGRIAKISMWCVPLYLQVPFSFSWLVLTVKISYKGLCSLPFHLAIKKKRLKLQWNTFNAGPVTTTETFTLSWKHNSILESGWVTIPTSIGLSWFYHWKSNILRNPSALGKPKQCIIPSEFWIFKIL